MNSPLFYIGIIFLLLGFSVFGITYGVYGNQLSFTCPADTATLQINAITASPNPVGTGQAFSVSGTMFAGTGCPSSDAGINYATYLVYWWVSGLSGYSGQFTVNYNGAFTITNIPTISTAGSYTIVVSPYSQTSGQNTGNICTPTAPNLTCTNALTTLTVQSTAATTYPVTFNVSPSSVGSLIQVTDSSGNSQYVQQNPSSAMPQINLVPGTYTYTAYPNENPGASTCYTTTNGQFIVALQSQQSVAITLQTVTCSVPNSNIIFVISPAISGTFTLNGETQTIPTNGQVTYTNMPAGIYTYTLSPSTTYPNCLYATVTGSISLPYAGGVANINPPSSNSASCVAPTTVTSTVTQTSSSTTQSCQLAANCPPPPHPKVIEIIQALSVALVVTGSIMTPLGVFIGSGRKR